MQSSYLDMLHNEPVSKFLPNFGNHLKGYTLYQTRRPQYEHTVTRSPHVLPNTCIGKEEQKLQNMFFSAF